MNDQCFGAALAQAMHFPPHRRLVERCEDPTGGVGRRQRSRSACGRCASAAAGSIPRSTTGAFLEKGVRLAGPAIVEQPDTTVAIDPGATAAVDGLGNLVISVGER